MSGKTIKVNYLARVEGEGGLYIRTRNSQVTNLSLNIFEPPRFFEAFLRGRRFDEAPDITSRICGICPVAHQMSAVHAIENALGITVEGQTRALRRLLCCGEYIESHALHIFLLHAPDFLGYDDAIKMARNQRQVVEMGLRLKKLGNRVMTILGGREVHPINVRVGGFYKLPAKSDLTPLVEELKWAQEAAITSARWTATLPFQDFEREYTFVALRHPSEYPFNEGRIVSNNGLDIPPQAYDEHFEEHQAPESHALHSRLKGQGSYLVGPLARYNLDHDRLSSSALQLASDVGLVPPVLNPFRSIIVRCIELAYACDEALRIIGEYEPPEKPSRSVSLKAGTGYGCTEAPRGLLYHRYSLDEQGTILDARIIPPTSQNQHSLEDDLRSFVPPRLSLEKEELSLQCEQLIRNYDPCISCATHFLKLELDQR